MCVCVVGDCQCQLSTILCLFIDLLRRFSFSARFVLVKTFYFELNMCVYYLVAQDILTFEFV